MNRYVIKFEKDGYVKYTSHLDILRIFKRSFKKTGFALKYSQGFNPHPKMGFAQPLSLGYSSKCELIEFETVEAHDPKLILEKMSAAMPEGLNLLFCEKFDMNVKSLAAEADSAVYTVWIPIPSEVISETANADVDKLLKDYYNQPEIVAMKRQKKTKKMAPVEIKKQIRGLSGSLEDNMAKIIMHLDCGSTSNLSPEQVISTLLSFAEWDVPRYVIEVERTELRFNKKIAF